MKKKTYEEKGITLIALVITIIVLLILAGVSLRLIAGEGGILGRTERAVSKNEIAGIKEEVDLFVADLGLKFYEEKHFNNAENLGKIDDYIEQEVGKASSEISKEYQLIIENGNVELKKEEELVAFGTLEKGQIIWGEGAPNKRTLVSQIKASNYGDSIKYSSNGVEDWKVFLNDGTNIYIITSDCVPDSSVPEEFREEPLWGKMDNTTFWEAFAQGISGAFAIGGPGMKQFNDSFNGKYGTNIDMHMDPDLSGMVGYEDLLYFPRGGKFEESGAYWLAYSYSMGPEMGTLSLSFSGKTDTYGKGGYRPLVCLPAETIGKLVRRCLGDCY